MTKRAFFPTGARLLAAMVLGIWAVAATPSQAASYPDRPVRLVVPYPPGGVTDTQARLLAQKLGERWGQTVIVDNKPGGNTVIATQQVTSAAPDGYTLLLTAMPVALNPLFLKLPYDTEKDLAPVTLLTSAPNVFIVPPSLGVKTVAEFVDKFKADGKKPVLFGSGGTLSFTHLGGVLFFSRSGIKYQHVPYRGSAPALQDLIAGRVDALFDNGALQHIKAGNAIPLGVTSSKRLPWLPDVPTIAEQGFPGFDAAAWFGIFTRAGTPPQVINQLAEDITWAIRSPDVAEKLALAGAIPGGGTPAEFRAFLDGEVARWTKIIKEENITIE